VIQNKFHEEKVEHWGGSVGSERDPPVFKPAAQSWLVLGVFRLQGTTPEAFQSRRRELN